MSDQEVSDLPTSRSPTGEAEFGTRNKKGEWRPPYPVEYAPLFVWPPKPISVLKWTLSYPGFLWPWNTICLAVTLLCWFYFAVWLCIIPFWREFHFY